MSEVKESSVLKVLTSIQKRNGYEIVEITHGYVKVKFNLEKVEVLDNPSIVYEAEIFKVANFVALAAVNELDSFVLSSHVDFLSQVEVESKELIFEAKAMSSSLGKKFVEVTAKSNDITIFIGDFTVLKLDKRTDLRL